MWKIPKEDEGENNELHHRRIEEILKGFSELINWSLSNGLSPDDTVYKVRQFKYELLKPISWGSYISEREKEDNKFKKLNLNDPGSYFSKH